MRAGRQLGEAALRVLCFLEREDTNGVRLRDGRVQRRWQVAPQDEPEPAEPWDALCDLGLVFCTEDRFGITHDGRAFLSVLRDGAAAGQGAPPGVREHTNS